MNIEGSTVLVTGASGGLGEAIALGLSAAGASLIITGRRQDQLDKLARATGARSVVADLSSVEGADQLLEEAGAIDILVANAGIPATGLLEEYSDQQVDRAIDVNLRVPIHLAHRLIPAMTSAGRGHLLFVSSLAGISATPRSSLYCATKFGLRGFALSLRQDLADSGVGVSVVLPGFVSGAGMFADSGATLPTGVGTVTPQKVAESVVQAITSNRGEVLVAPRHLSFGARISGWAPALGARAQRSGVDLAETMSESQRSKR